MSRHRALRRVYFRQRNLHPVCVRLSRALYTKIYGSEGVQFLQWHLQWLGEMQENAVLRHHGATVNGLHTVASK